MIYKHLILIVLLLVSYIAKADSLTTRFGTVNIKSENTEGIIYLDNTIIFKTAADFLLTDKVYHLGEQDIIPISDTTISGNMPNFQYILVIKPDHTTYIYEHPELSKKTNYKIIDGTFIAKYDNEIVTYDGQKFDITPYDPDLFRPLSHLPLELCEGLYDIREEIIRVYKYYGDIDSNNFAQYARYWIEEVYHYPFFSPEKLIELEKNGDQNIEKLSLEEFKNTICVDTTNQY